MKPSGAAAHVREGAVFDALLRELDAATPSDGLSAELPSALWDRALRRPAQEFLNRPGKEFRARLVALSWELGCGRGRVEERRALPEELPLLVEVLHAGSLIIDDIQDEAAERRGAASLHRVYGVPLAINTGNWMYFWAFTLLGRARLRAAAGHAIYRRLSRTILRCHEGQALDLTAHVGELEQPLLPRVVASITRLKTGNLMAFCGYLGARAAGASPLAVRSIARFTRDVGVGLQMLDDLGGLLSKARARKAMEDLRHGRATWPWAWLSETADPVTYARLQQRLRGADGDGDLRKVAEGLREHVEALGRIRIARHLNGAVKALRGAVGDAPPLVEIAREIERLRKSYG